MKNSQKYQLKISKVTEQSYASQQSCSVHIYFLWNRFWVSVMRVSNKSRIIWVSFPDLPQEKCYQVDYLSWERYSSTGCFSECHDIVVYILYVSLLLVNGIKTCIILTILLITINLQKVVRVFTQNKTFTSRNVLREPFVFLVIIFSNLVLFSYSSTCWKWYLIF